MFQSTPIVLNVVIFAVVGWVVRKANLKTARVRKLDHPLEKTGSAAATFRPIVHVDDKTVDISKAFPAAIPPKIDAVHQEIAGLVAVRQEQEGFAGLCFHYSPGHQLFLGHHLVVKGLYWFQSTGFALSRVVADMDGGFRVHADANRFGVRISFGIYRMDIFENLVCPFVFF